MNDLGLITEYQFETIPNFHFRYELHRIAAGEETSLQQILKDGIVLCRIVNCLSPNTIAKVSPEKSAESFRENYEYFQKALQDLGIGPLCNSDDCMYNMTAIQECLTSVIQYCDQSKAKKYDESFGPDLKGSSGKAVTVMATHGYEAQNMDELTFNKGKFLFLWNFLIYQNTSKNNIKKLPFFAGDIISVTQMVDGGWWEGSLNGEVGWFPSNFVKDFGVIDTGIETKRTSNILSMTVNEEDFTNYKTVVEGLNLLSSLSLLDPKI